MLDSAIPYLEDLQIIAGEVCLYRYACVRRVEDVRMQQGDGAPFTRWFPPFLNDPASLYLVYEQTNQNFLISASLGFPLPASRRRSLLYSRATHPSSHFKSLSALKPMLVSTF